MNSATSPLKSTRRTLQTPAHEPEDQNRRKRQPRPRVEIQVELLNAREAAQLLGWSLRALHYRRAMLPAPIVFSEKCIRWRRADLLAWIAALPTGPSAPQPEPPGLAAGRRRDRAAGGDPEGTGAHHGREAAPDKAVWWRKQESNPEDRTGESVA